MSRVARPGEWWRFPEASAENIIFVVRESRDWNAGEHIPHNAIWVNESTRRAGMGCYVATDRPSPTGQRVADDQVPAWAWEGIGIWALGGADLEDD